MALEYIRSNNRNLNFELVAISQAVRQLRDRVKTVFGVMNDSFVDTGVVANNNYAPLEAVFNIMPAQGGSTGDTSNGYKAWYKVATLNDVLSNNSGVLDAAAHDLA
jgi:hypothetical protein